MHGHPYFSGYRTFHFNKKVENVPLKDYIDNLTGDEVNKTKILRLFQEVN